MTDRSADAHDVLAHGAAIVLVGNFNPAIFSPSWFEVAKLASSEDVEEAKVGVIHAQMADFTLPGIRVFVDADRFQLSTNEEPFVRLVDWVDTIFGQLLTHTPINQAGINYSCHFAVESLKQRHALGRSMAPIGPWGAWGEALDEPEDPAELGGLRSVSMLQTNIAGRERGYRQAQLEPSLRQDIVDKAVGVYMLVNDHFEIANAAQTSDPQTAVQWVTENFDESIAMSKSIVAGVQQFASKL